MRRLIVLLSCLLVLAPALHAGGSRDRFLVGGGVNIPVNGGFATFGTYFRLGYAYLEGTYNIYKPSVSAADIASSSPSVDVISARAGYRLRIVSVGSHTANLYIGAAALGERQCVQASSTQLYTWGLVPSAELEILPFRHVGIVADCSRPFRFGDSLLSDGFVFRAGLRFVF